MVQNEAIKILSSPKAQLDGLMAIAGAMPQSVSLKDPKTIRPAARTTVWRHLNLMRLWIERWNSSASGFGGLWHDQSRIQPSGAPSRCWPSK
jgi:hypothetical protein